MHNFDSTWFASAPVNGATPFKRISWKAYNRTGSVLTAGGVYQFDTQLNLAAESVANSEGVILPAVTDFKWGPAERQSAWRNVRAVQSAAAGLHALFGAVFCVALGATPDNELGDMLVVGEASILAIGTAAGGVGSGVYRPSSVLTATVAQAYLTYIEAQTTTAADANAAALLANAFSRKRVAISLASRTETATPAATAVNCFFNGFGL